MLVAAHPLDLKGARGAGLQTAFVDRPLEYGSGSAAREDPDRTNRSATYTSWQSGWRAERPLLCGSAEPLPQCLSLLS